MRIEDLYERERERLCMQLEEATQEEASAKGQMKTAILLSREAGRMRGNNHERWHALAVAENAVL